MRLRRPGEPVWAMPRRTRRSASRSTVPKTLSGLVKSGFLPRPDQRFQLTVNYIWASKMTQVIRLAIDSFRKRCTLMGPYRVLRNSPRRFRMAIQAHLVHRERKQKSLENELHEPLIHVPPDDLQIPELKRRKLMVKDKTERPRQPEAAETLQ